MTLVEQLRQDDRLAHRPMPMGAGVGGGFEEH